MGLNTAPDVHNRSNDPNVLQRAASNPDESIWVGASAGTGKTKVLTDRVLRLLLPRDDGRPATLPSRILCLTFTKAAANEMALRITEKLAEWAVMDIDHEDQKKSLRKVLGGLLGKPPTDEQLNAAQRLFADVIDCAGGLQIMTIHSFCQSVLGRFPIEADLAPGFKIMEEAGAAKLMKRAQSDVLEDALKDENAGSAISVALHNLAQDLHEEAFEHLIKDVCAEKLQISKTIQSYGSVEGVYAALCEFYDVPLNQSSADVYSVLATAVNEGDLRLAADAMLQGAGKDETKSAQSILEWLRFDVAERVQSFDVYKAAFLTSGGTLRARGFPTKATEKILPACRDILEKEGERILRAVDQVKRIKSAALTRDALVLGGAISDRYGALKQAQGGVDFDDLIMRTMALLQGKSQVFSLLEHDDQALIPSWVMYKMDQGLDHILVDEAQDTNPEQWQIIEALCQEFFDGFGARDDVLRTSFTVGDIKQSIYSFQRAAPDEFKRMQRVLDEKIIRGGGVNNEVNLEISFRSTESVLHVVDQVFSNPERNKAVGGGVIHHESFRAGQAGRVELWPYFETPKREQRDFWDPPVYESSPESGSSQAAAYIADNIRNWLERKEYLPAYGRSVQAGDILILVKSRGAFVEQMVRALKVRKIPVSGADRMVIGEQLAVQDLMSLARFCLNHQDDLTLAEVLKSPFLGWSEEELFSLSYGRKGSLWQELCNFDGSRIRSIPDAPDDIVIVADEKRQATRDYIARLSGRARYLGAYEFFSYVLNTPCPADDFSGERAVRYRLGDDALDPIEELMNAALEFSYDEVDHLQVFLQWAEQNNIEIKREMDEQGGQVRIMTVHGSKGLQAPIVIMPDTMLSSSGKKGGRLLLPHKTGMDIPLYSVRGDDDPDQYAAQYQKCESLDDEEYYRLLYVAMTRAADRLYITGYKGSRKAKDHSWYNILSNVIKNDTRCEEVEENVWRIENEQAAEPDKVKKRDEGLVFDGALPEWIFDPVPEEAMPPKPLVPSRPNDEELEAVTSPLVAGQESRFKRGNVTHKLLQFLPDFDDSKREAAAIAFVRKNASGFSESVQKSIVDEVMDILGDSEFAPFFAKGSMAEVSVTGLMADNRIVSGQIDRLVVGDEDVWIVDYKTNRPPPTDPNDVPQIYRNQLAAYRDSIQAIYPQHKVHTALLWTDGPYLTIVQ